MKFLADGKSHSYRWARQHKLSEREKSRNLSSLPASEMCDSNDVKNGIALRMENWKALVEKYLLSTVSNDDGHQKCSVAVARRRMRKKMRI